MIQTARIRVGEPIPEPYHWPKTKSAYQTRSFAIVTWRSVADNLRKRGWSWGCVSAIDSNGRTIWIVDVHRDGKRFIVGADEKLSAFLELERATRRRQKKGLQNAPRISADSSHANG